MNVKGRRLLVGIMLIGGLLASTRITGTAVMASNTDYLETLSTGIAEVLEADLVVMADTAKEKKQEMKEMKEMKKEEEPKSDLVMANVQKALNVRAEADEDSDKIGMLYVDCGGKIMERKNGWTKLKSGSLEGWAHDEYLLFDKDAETMAEDVGNLIVTIEAEALRVRKEPKEDAGIYGLLAKDDELIVIEDLGDWISIEYNNQTGYISEEYVDVDFHIDAGETMVELKAREKKEAEEKAKRTANQGAVAVGVSDEVLLAALIQCEAGSQPFDGQVGVGAVVMNRVRSGGYPNTITGVIYASGQFPPALSGKVARVAAKGVKESCLLAAQQAIEGATTVGGSTRFRRANGRDGIVIGNHVFW